MKAAFVAIAAALAIVTVVTLLHHKPVVADPVDAAWVHWKQTMGKAYGTSSEEVYRKANFSYNYGYANSHNANEDNTEKLGMTMFADLTLAEFTAQFTGLKSGFKPSGPKLETAVTDVPDSVDWSKDHTRVGPVQNQGQCGSCWAFGTVAAAEGDYSRVNGNLLKFSEQRLVDCSTSYGNQGCNGGDFDPAFHYMKDHGHALNSNYGYTGRDGTCKTDVAEEKNTRPLSYGQVAQGEVALKTALVKGPVAVGVDAASLTWQLYFGGVTQGWTCGSDIDHAVTLVGYGESSIFGLVHLPYWKIRNSWGRFWGEAGYIRMKRVADSTDAGTCGVQSQAWAVSYD